ncbi:hypothetical protein A2875_00200 [Candidatus Gottesmanbacteria bacterium RIFCSPHIGHO2_01_FULL_46_14]|uniref:CBS domain-containing protein n=2 Tax=Candidatus Gottesmaniibacteriota TaxID=1752720 RepID=A0A1F5ZKU6_9BACT|nr:MAG: hypothetical protein A2875_00200 [Candidatus Gottesmanbacteria bacterium RIFCSPHIGHO2_01_FULL_46_14]
MKVRDVMSRKIISVGRDSELRELWKIIFKIRVNAIPVVDTKGKLLGIITKDDILHLFYPDYEDLVEDFFSVSNFEEMENRIDELGSKRARDIMNKRIIFTREDCPIMRALSRMIVRNFNQLPVVSDDDRLVGMVTKGDIFSALFRAHLKGK